MNSELPGPSHPQPAPNVVPCTTSEAVYRLIGEHEMDAVQPLWEKLRAYHASLPWRFAAEMDRSTFELRKQDLLAKAASGKLRIELVSNPWDMVDVAYGISSVSADGQGEVDSLYVDEGFRGHGIGSELLRRALTWLVGAGATSKRVMVAHGNEAAIALYQRFGFYPRTVVLQQNQDDA